uniref:Uncharacterized protein n=1 Tax=Chelydra serpentina TaxID=8475 RepID=A0A8C3XMU6_CHESE
VNLIMGCECPCIAPWSQRKVGVMLPVLGLTAASLPQSLTELDLHSNELGDAGVQWLCEGLTHPNCKLQKLGLQRCHLTGACCGDLTTVLRTNQSLTELELGANVGLGDSGVQQLCEGLKHSNCKLQRLDLWDCGLMDAGCMDLAAVLRTSQSLTELKLSHNKLGDAGVKLLCEGLKQNCKLQSLSLRWCNITNAGCGDLADVLRINQYLTKLMLGYNKDLGDSGVRLLCEGLKDPNCKLQMLDTACCEDLSAALTTSQTLTYLDLAANRVEDSGVWLLCEGLKHPNCKLQRLRLGRCDLTDAGCGDLSAVLRANQSLTELELSYNKLGDAVVQLLCEILKHPNCKLQRLGLAGCYLTDAASADLATVLRTSQSLTELDLSGNNPGDAGVQLLCEALKHPNCKLQRLGTDNTVCFRYVTCCP